MEIFMSPCTKARIQTAVARLLAVGAVGVAAWFIADVAAQRFALELTEPMKLGIGGLFGVIALFVSKRVFDFTEDCMSIPDTALAPGLHTGKGSCRKKNCRLNDEATAAGPNAPAADADNTLRVAAPVNLDSSATASTVVLQTEKITVSLNTADGTTTVKVVASGLTANQFKGNNGLRQRLEKISGIAWQRPQNLGDSNRQMEGKITDAAKREEVVARILELGKRL
jgi:hypothetical protein